MAITVAALNVAPQTSTAGMTTWAWRGHSADASGSEELVAAPEPGYRLFITSIRLTSNANVDVWLCDDDGTLVTPEIYFLTTGSGFYEADYSHDPLYLADGKALHVDAGGAGDVSIEVEGFTAGAAAEIVKGGIRNGAYIYYDSRTANGTDVTDDMDYRIFDAFGTDVVKYIQDFAVLPTDDTTGLPSEWLTTPINADTAALTTIAGGALLLTTDGAENDGPSCQLKGEAFQMATGKPLYFGAELAISDATESDFIVGLCITDQTLLTAMTYGMYFRTVDGSTALATVTELNTAETECTAIHTLVADTYLTLEMYAASSTEVDFYVNGTKVATHTGGLPTAEVLTPSIEFLTGDAAAITMTVKWLRAIQLN